MPSTMTRAETYSAKELRRDAKQVAELLEKALVARNAAVTIAGRIAEQAILPGMRFTLGFAVADTADSIVDDVDRMEVMLDQLVEYGQDLVKLVELATTEVTVDA